MAGNPLKSSQLHLRGNQVAFQQSYRVHSQSQENNDFGTTESVALSQRA